MQSFNQFRQSLNQRTETEFGQTLIRLALSLFVVVYCNLLVWRDEPLDSTVYLVAHLYLVISLLLSVSTIVVARPSVLRRVVGTLTDVTAVTIGMVLSSYYTSLFWGGYLWISIGNGLRFGNRYLLASVIVSAMSFAYVVAVTDYWQQNFPLAMGLFVWMLLIPLYVAMLIKRYVAALHEAKEASKTKSRFLANMSHELRTPLNAIIGYTELLMEDAAIDNRKHEVEDLAKVKSSAAHLLNLINELLDISKIEAGKMELNYEQVDVAHLVDEIADALKPLMDKNKNKLSVMVLEDVGRLSTDVLKLRQVLFNLLSNASKFTENGEVSLFVTMVTRGSGRWLKMVVKDTGIGMTQAQLGRLFQPFVQADEKTATKYGGTGLGLALCKEFAEMMGGEIDAYSEQGRGSTFIVMLPVLERAAAAEKQTVVA